MDLQSLDWFMKVADAQSLSAAARRHGMPKSTISLKLRQLEEDVGATLFERRGKALELTESGRLLMERARQILALCDDARGAVAAVQHEASGVLRIGATGEFGTALNAQMLQAFRQMHPQVRLDLVFFAPSVLMDSAQLRSFDAILSFEAGDTPDPEAQILTSVRSGLFASPRYLAAAGVPATVEDLARHRGLLYRASGGVPPWSLLNGRRSLRIQPPGDVVANDYWTLKYFAVAGAGIALLPQFFTELEVAQGHLCPVLPAWQSEARPISIRVPDPRFVAPRTRAFIDFCKAYFQPGFAFAGPRYFVEALMPGASPSLPPSQPENPK